MDYNSSTPTLNNGPEAAPCPDAQRQAGTGSGPLVTNTVLSTPNSVKNALEAASLLGFLEKSKVSKRYALQSVSKEALEACKCPDDTGEKPKFYRLGACSAVSTEFRPDNFRHGDYDVLKKFKEDISIASLKYRLGESGEVEPHLSGMMRCDSSWICPVCGPVISEYRAKEVYEAMHTHQSKGGYLLFVTFTLRHGKGMALPSTLGVLSKTLGRLKSGKAWTTFKDRYGYLGSIRSQEYTYTESAGHHPHVHELWFFDKRPPVTKLKKELFSRYKRYVERYGGKDYSPTFARGIDVKLLMTEGNQKQLLSNPNLDLEDIGAIADYCTKGADVDKTLSDALESRQWSAADELTKHQHKIGKNIITAQGKKIVSYNSTQLLINIAGFQALADRSVTKIERDRFLKKKMRFTALYRDYGNAFFGKRLNYWSPGLKDRFSIGDVSESEVSEFFHDDLTYLMCLTVSDLRTIIKKRLRARVLDVVADPSLLSDDDRVSAVREFLKTAVRTDRYG